MSTGPGCPAEDLSSAALALARRLSCGATLWSVSPAWPEHAQHVAVEFVHPVIVGKRALPAVALHDADPVGALRALGRAGDMLVGIGSSEEPVVVDLMRRAPAWGLETVWIGAGPRPCAGAADHVLWLDDGPDHHLVPYTGGFVLLYHLLCALLHCAGAALRCVWGVLDCRLSLCCRAGVSPRSDSHCVSGVYLLSSGFSDC